MLLNSGLQIVATPKATNEEYSLRFIGMNSAETGSMTYCDFFFPAFEPDRLDLLLDEPQDVSNEGVKDGFQVLSGESLALDKLIQRNAQVPCHSP